MKEYVLLLKVILAEQCCMLKAGYGMHDTISCMFVNYAEFFGGSLLSHQAAASGPLLLASIGREQILDMLCKVWDLPSSQRSGMFTSLCFSVPRKCARNEEYRSKIMNAACNPISPAPPILIGYL